MEDTQPPVDIPAQPEQKPGQTLRTFSNMLNPYFGKKKPTLRPKWIHAKKPRGM